jgi:hypothetical protein
MLTNPTITTSSVGVDRWRENVVIVIMRWTLVIIIEEVAGHHARVYVRVGQHKSDSHLHDELSISTLISYMYKTVIKHWVQMPYLVQSGIPVGKVREAFSLGVVVIHKHKSTSMRKETPFLP